MTQDYQELEQEKHGGGQICPAKVGTWSGCLGRSQVQGESGFVCLQ